MPAGPTQSGHGRLPELDGVRGIAIVLVVLSHAWTLFPLQPLRKIAPFDGLFHAGNVAVTVFLVIGGFSVTRSLLQRAERPGGIRPWWYVAERLARVAPQLYVLLAVVVLVHLVPGADPYRTRATLESVATAATHTFNWLFENNALVVRPDLGHLWYLSVSEQFYVGLTLVFALFLSRHRQAVTVGLLVVLVLVTIWRAHAFHHEPFLRVSVRTSVRMDGLLWGALAALTIDRFAVWRTHAARMLPVALIVMTGVVLSTGRLGDNQYYTVIGVVMNAATTALVVAVYHLTANPVHMPAATLTSRLRGALSWSPLVRLGVMSLAIYVWHYPIFWFVAQHTAGWGQVPRTVSATALVIVVVYLAERFIDPPARRLVAWLAARQASAGPARRDVRLPLAAQPADPLQEGHGSVV